MKRKFIEKNRYILYFLSSSTSIVIFTFYIQILNGLPCETTVFYFVSKKIVKIISRTIENHVTLFILSV